MRLVLDSSIVLTLVALDTAEAQLLRDSVLSHLDGDSAHIIDTLTPLEVVSALRYFEEIGEISSARAAAVRRGTFGWPFVRERITQARLERVWELSRDFTPYDAAYLATTEALQSELKGDVALATADTKISGARLETLPCRVLRFPAS